MLNPQLPDGPPPADEVDLRDDILGHSQKVLERSSARLSRSAMSLRSAQDALRRSTDCIQKTLGLLQTADDTGRIAPGATLSERSPLNTMHHAAASGPDAGADSRLD